MTIACSLWQPASTTTELSRAAAAFRSSTRRLQPLQHILGGLRLHEEWPNVSTFSDLHADYDVVCGIGWVGQGSSPGVSVAVGPGVSTIGLMGLPVSRSTM